MRSEIKYIFLSDDFYFVKDIKNSRLQFQFCFSKVTLKSKAFLNFPNSSIIHKRCPNLPFDFDLQQTKLSTKINDKYIN